MLQLLKAAFFSYLLGSISFPGLYSKLKGIDLKTKGYGHLGATSLYRATNSLTLFVFLGLLDALKGTISYLLFGPLGLTFAMLGHMLPVFFSFSGGNAVSVYYGGIFVVFPLLSLFLALFELLIWKIVRSNLRHIFYLAIRAVPAVISSQLLPAYILLLIKHLYFYFSRRTFL